MEHSTPVFPSPLLRQKHYGGQASPFHEPPGRARLSPARRIHVVVARRAGDRRALLPPWFMGSKRESRTFGEVSPQAERARFASEKENSEKNQSGASEINQSAKCNGVAHIFDRSPFSAVL